MGLRWHGGSSEVATATLDAELTQVVGAPITARRRFAQAEQAFLREHAPGLFKVTLPGVMQQALHWYRPGVTDQHDSSTGELPDAMAALVADEVRALTGEAVRYIQLDSLVYVTQYGECESRAGIERRGLDAEQVLADTIRTDNVSLNAAQAGGAIAALHMCRGNNRSAWTATGGYESMAEQAFFRAGGRPAPARVRQRARRRLCAVAVCRSQHDRGTGAD
jgi:5-methyltetrahydropteroyltriglutamate--homocysteine methyltransferase